MLLKNKYPHFAGKSITFAEIGKQTLDENGMLEVPDAFAKRLLDGGEWKKVVNDEDEEEIEGAPAAESLDLNDLLASIDSMDLKSLQEIAAESKIKNWEKFKENEKVLRAYIKNQLKKSN